MAGPTLLMTTFAVYLRTGSDLAAQRIQSEYPDDSLNLSHDLWLVSSEETSQEVAERLQIRSEERNPATSGIVFRVENWSGFADKSVWEWLGAKNE